MRPGGLLAHPAGAGLESMHPFVPLLAFGELGQVAAPRCLVFKERVYLELLQEQGWSSASLDRAPPPPRPLAQLLLLPPPPGSPKGRETQGSPAQSRGHHQERVGEITGCTELF